ncbi:hypothetical protein BKA70DRAFT_1256658 [Coprinopsis sp. MPI-PUGE-AT-0042]|nr:hypothetical protein BKA70DRAFT_1256658 [Coprinopsis sp. MPI-PUGE-AT-0042]
MIAYLKKKHNELAPVSSLPAELLSIILHIAILKTPPSFSSRYNTLSTFSWVCTRWRAAALNDTSFWSTISSFLPMNWQTAFLERSRHAPLWVSMMSYDPKSHRINAMLSQTSRIRGMTFDGNSTTVNNVVAALASPAPLLEALKISLLNSWPFILEQGVVLARNPQHLQAPLLWRVDFTNCTLPWNSSAFRTITSVKITFERCSPPFTSSELYEGLKAIAPRLQELGLRFDVDLKTDGVLYDPIAFPKLEKLALSNAGENSMGLLHFIHLPTSTQLDLNCESPEIQDIESMCSDIANSWVSAPLSKPRRLPFLQRLSVSYYNYNRELKIFGWNRYADGSNEEKGRMLAIHSLASNTNLNMIINIILSSLPVWNIPALELGGEWTNAANLQQVLLKMPALREIKFSGHITSINTFCSTLVEDANGAPSSTAPPTLPSLQVIMLEHLQVFTSSGVAGLIERLSRALAWRRAKGRSSIQSIILKTCGPIDEDVLNQLKDFIVTGVKNVIRIG